jgi:replicative DNA helicase
MSGSSISLVTVEAEEVVLGACLLSSATFIAVMTTDLKPEDFNVPMYTKIYSVMLDMFQAGEQISVLALCAHFENRGDVSSIGGLNTIKRLPQVAQTYLNDSLRDIDGALNHVEVIRDRAVRRSLREASERIINLIHSEPDVRTLVTACEQSIFSATEQTASSSGYTGSDLVGLYASSTSKSVGKRTPYPFKQLNKYLTGKSEGSLIIWGGYSSDGKSVLGLQNLATSCKDGAKVGYFSLEMTEEELLFRLIAMETGLPMTKIEFGGLDFDESRLLDTALGKIKDWDFTIYSDPDITPGEIRARQTRERFNSIGVDYLQRFPYREYREIPRIAKLFKNIALSTKCSVDLLSQLTPGEHGLGKNPFTRPHIHSLYGGKATAHEANNVIFIWAERTLGPHGGWERTGNGEIISAKARSGKAEFSFPVTFNTSRLMWEE